MDVALYTYADSLYSVANETAGERFCRLMEEKGLGIRPLSRRAGVSHGTIQNLRHRGLGESSHETIRRVAEALGVTPTNLRRIVDGFDPTPDSVYKRASKYEVHPNWLQYPVYGTVSAGDVEADPLEDDVAFVPREHLTRRGANLDSIRVYRVNGRCMISPEAMRMDRSYAPGDYVAIDLSKQVEAGDVVVAWWDEEDTMVIKRFGIEKDTIVLTPIAPGRPSITLPSDAHVSILGPVVWRGG